MWPNDDFDHGPVYHLQARLADRVVSSQVMEEVRQSVRIVSLQEVRPDN